MPFRPEDIHDFQVAREIRIETHRPDGRVRSTIVWVVEDRGELFVRSEHGERGRWYQEALADPHVTIDDQGRRLEAIAVPVHDAESIQRVDEALNRKYAGRDGLAPMLTPEARQATLRLDPRTPDEVPLEAPEFLGAEGPSQLGGPVDVSMLDGEQPVDEDVLLQPHKSV